MGDLNTNNLSFGFSALHIIDNETGDAGHAAVVGSLTANLSGELMPLPGGGATLPIAAAKGRADGALTISLSERPEWVKTKVMDMGKTDLVTSLDLSNMYGDVKDKLTLNEVAAGSAIPGIYLLEVVSAAATKATINVKAIKGDGISDLGNIVDLVSGTAQVISNSGLKLDQAAASAVKSTDVGAIAVAYIFSGELYKLPPIQVSGEFSVIAASNVSQPGYSLMFHRFPKVALTGGNPTLTANENPSTEITGFVLEPGGDISAYSEYVVA